MAKVIYKFEEGISINSKGYALDENGDLMLFSDEQSAIDLLIFNGIPEEDINDGIFIADYDEEFGEDS